MTPTLLQVFAKIPHPGEVKTRLIPELGKSVATQVYLHCLQHNLDLMQNCGYEHQLWLNKMEPYSLFEHLPTLIQQGNDLGEKMQYALQSGLRNHAKTILIGSDCIEITTQHLQQVDQLLNQYDVAFIPAQDGGYVLVAARGHIHPELFRNISWSSHKVMQQTLDKCQQLDLAVALLNPLRDIDHAADLQHYDALKHFIDS